jgi:molybdate transport system substrate-binding protein
MRSLAALCSPLVVAVTLAFTGVAQAKTLTVFAAASLTEYLREGVKPAFEKANPGVSLRISLASSGECRMQIEQGAPADVFMSADTSNMDRLVGAKLVARPVTFAHNTVAAVVPIANPGHVNSLRDLAKPRLRLVLPDPAAPIGHYAYQVLGNMDRSGRYGKNYLAGVERNVLSHEPNVKSAVAKVLLGEADATMCYISDATPEVRKRVKVLTIPDELIVIAEYPMAVVAQSRQKALAQTFISFVTSERGQALLAEYGFLPVKPARPGRG